MRTFWLVLVLLSTLLMGGCELVGDIFKAGFAVGVIAIVLVIAIVGFLVAKLRA